jgi:Tol biopolymer transport system component
MSLAPGTRLGPYEIVSLLGAGGMGEVFRARDSRLGRDVAIKVLPERLSSDVEAHARFEREAHAVAALSHPNIVALLDIGKSGETAFAVMELLNGETLRERLHSGALPGRKAVETACEVAIGLAAAHEHGIVHRDLKPENIFLTRDGRVKLLDFGLAKDLVPRSPDATSAPTIAPTEPGTVMGTVGYMSPEQVRGKTADHRTDIFSFGAVLYEMMAGRRAFEGSSAVETMNAILVSEPPEIAADASGVSPAAARIVRRCLEKAPEQRFQSARDLAFALEALGGDSAATRAPFARTRRWRAALGPVGAAASAVALLLAAVFATLYFRSARERELEARRVMRLQIAPANVFGLMYWGRTFAISSDGTRLVYAASKGASSELVLRALDGSESVQIPGTEGGIAPFFSPDGRWVAFAAGGKLKKVAVAGGTPLTLCDAPIFRGAVWATDDFIYYVPSIYSAISRVPADGGTPQTVTKIRAADGEQQHRWPEVLPGAKYLLYVIGSGGEWDDATIVAERLGSGERTVLVKGGTFPRYVPTGHLIYARAGALYALAFDPRSAVVHGTPVEVARNVLVDPAGAAQMDVSRSGLLVTAPRSAAGEVALSWVDRSGRGEPLSVPRGPYLNMAISPDGTRVALGVGNSIAVLDLGRMTVKKLALPARGENPVWSADGQRVLFGLEKGRHFEVFSKAADDSGTAQLVIPSEGSEDPLHMSADGAWLLTARTGVDSQTELLLRETASLATRAQPKSLLKSASLADYTEGSLSPDARWVAYVSNESGRAEVYVRPASGEDRKWQVSTEGGRVPIYSRDGREIFYLCGMKFMAAPVEATGREVRIGTPRVLFENHEIVIFDVSRDGQRFLVAENPSPGASSRLDVVVNWFAEVRRKTEQ